MCKMGIDCPPDNTLLGDYGNEGGDDYGQEEPEEEEDLHVEQE